MYSLLRKFLFQLEPETAHHVTLTLLNLAHRMRLTHLFSRIPDSPREVMGLQFKNHVGLAAGLDKNADYVDALATLGFGFIEVGTVTPKPQPGNPPPRLFRLVQEEALINRMGFNSLGADYVVKRLEKIAYRGVLGINIGKNRDTPPEHAIDDYVFGFKTFAKFASYITVNISSPNTAGLRDLQAPDALLPLLKALKQEQRLFADNTGKYVPIVVKIAPDLSEVAVREMATIFLELKIDGVIATNTTLSRDGVTTSRFANEVGGLSGKPLCARNTAIVKSLFDILQDRIPIIAVGGISDESSAREKFTAGAHLIQLYTGLIYKGPGLVRTLIHS